MNWPSPNGAEGAASEPLRGVTGWLLFFCITLTFIGPIVQGSIALHALTTLLHGGPSNFATTVRLMVVGFIYTCLSILSCYAGVSLWREDPGGPEIAKFYLLFSAVLVISLDTVLYFAGVEIRLARILFQRLTYSIIWYAYLTFSKRVREVYRRTD